jgi:hypothetical protein
VPTAAQVAYCCIWCLLPPKVPTEAKVA